MSTQLATTEKNDIRTLLQSDKIREQVTLALPRFVTPERMLRICLTSINRNPKLLECTRESLLSAIMQSAQMGIEPDGRYGHLIPRFNGRNKVYEATFQPDYKGFISLIRRNENVADIYAEIVCANDHIKITKGLKRDLEHEVDIKSERGPIIGVYAVILYKDGTTSYEYLTREEVESIRDRSDSWKAHKEKGYSTPWVTDEGEMFKKTAIKRIAKTADLSGDTSELLNRDPEYANFMSEREPARVEIQSAQVPQPALPEKATPTNQEESATVAKEAAQEQVSKQPAAKTQARGKLTTKRQSQPAQVMEAETTVVEPGDSQPEIVQLSPVAQKVATKLHEEGFTPAHLLRVAIANEWCQKCDADNTPLSYLEDEKLEAFLEDWETVIDEIKNLEN